MKNLRSILYAFLFGAASMALCVLAHGRDGCPVNLALPVHMDAFQQERIDDGTKLKAGLYRIASGALTGGTGPAGETDLDVAPPLAPEPAVEEVPADRTNMHLAEAMVKEADRIVSDLEQDRALTGTVGFACAYADPGSSHRTPLTIIERLRAMHEMYQALMETASTLDDRDRQVTRGRDQIQQALVAIQKMAVELRGQTGSRSGEQSMLPHIPKEGGSVTLQF